MQGEKLGVVLNYSLNPAYHTEPTTFNNLILKAIYKGPKAAAAQLKPPGGIHVKEQSLVYWKLGDVTLSSDPQKLVCMFTAKDGAMPEPGHIEARWEVDGGKDLALGSGIGISRLEVVKAKEESDDPFADETIASPSMAGTWLEIDTYKKLVSGKYEFS